MHWLSLLGLAGSFGDQIYAVRPYSPQVPRAVQVLVVYLRAALAGGFEF